MKMYFKIVEVKNDKYYTLFHGIKGTKLLPLNQWIEAEIKENVSDGHGTTYTSGIHIIDGFLNAVDYLKKFKRTDRDILPCYAEGLKPKVKSKEYVYLADKVFLFENIE